MIYTALQWHPFKLHPVKNPSTRDEEPPILPGSEDERTPLFHFVLKFTLMAGLSLFLLHCSRPTEPVNYEIGEHKCEHCMMLIVGKQFRTQAITTKGRVYHFDAIECMLSWKRENQMELESMWASNYTQPDQFLNWDEIVVVQSEKIQSPMGANLAAMKRESAEKLLSEIGGQILNEQDLDEYISRWNSRKMQRHEH